MKHQASIAAVAVLSTALLAAGSYAAAPSAEATTALVIAEGIPGGIIIDTLTIEAEVLEINHEARTATLLLPGGEAAPIAVGPEAINFDLVQKGDSVKALITRELAIYIGADDATDEDGAEVAAVLAEKGEQPGGIVAGSIRATATVTAIDLEAHTATLAFEDGSSQTVEVRADVDLSNQKVGTKVVFEVSKMVALSVEKN